MSDFETFVDVVAADLKLHVVGLRDAVVHRLAAWDPEELEATGVEHHLAIWPAGEALDEQALPLTTNAHMLRQTYRLLYWEPSGDESSRAILNEQVAVAIFDLQNAVRTRLYAITPTDLGGAILTYRGSGFPDRSGQVHWFAMQFTVDTTIDF